MLSIRKKIAPRKLLVSALLVAGSLAVAGTVQTASPASSAPAAGDALRRAGVTASILPGIIAPGSGLQSSASAKWAVTGHFSPTKVGKKVLLQQQSGTTWKTVDKTLVNKNGNVLFAVPRGVPTSPVVYRISGAGATSAPVSTARWAGTPADFDDEFSGTRLSPSWVQRQQFYEPLSKRECSKGDPKAVKVGHGTVQLSVLVDKSINRLCKPKKPGKNVIFGKFRYRLNGNIGTQGTEAITYGIVAARMKFQPLQGQHASLWMQPTVIADSTNPKIQGTEIDIIEWFGKDTKGGGLTSFIYAPTVNGKKVPLGGDNTGGFIRHPEQYLSNPKDDWYKRYHVFSVEWTPSAYIFRIDGQETGRITNPKYVSGVPEYPILSLLSSDYELSKLPGREKSLPQTMSVDWIRTWQDPDHYIPPPSPTATP